MSTVPVRYPINQRDIEKKNKKQITIKMFWSTRVGLREEYEGVWMLE